MEHSTLATSTSFVDYYHTASIQSLAEASFQKIAPFWPLRNLIAVNPLQGLEDLPIEKALENATQYFQQKTLPEPMHTINRHTIRWLQAYCDEGQASLPCLKTPKASTLLGEAWSSTTERCTKESPQKKQP